MSKEFLYKQEDDVLHFKFKDIDGDEEMKLSQLTLWILECEKYKLDFTIEIDSEILDSSKMSIFEILERVALY